MNIRPVIELARPAIPIDERRITQPTQYIGENEISFNLQAEISNAAEEIADILSTFGRFSRVGRKNDAAVNDFVSSMLEDQSEQKLDLLVRQIAKLQDLNHFLNFSRSFFPNDSDLMLALQEMLFSRKLSERLKKKIKEAIADLKKFGDLKKIQSGINVARLARRFNEGCKRSLSAQDFRNSYLNFIELELPAGIIYKDWIDTYGYENRTSLLAFTLSALVTDMKANEPGIHASEFGPLSARLSDARILHTLDILLNEKFSRLSFREQMRNQQLIMGEGDIVSLYISGIVSASEFKLTLKRLNNDFMSQLLIKQRATVIQTLCTIYRQTPESIFVDVAYRDVILGFITSLLLKMHEKEKHTSVWRECYKF